MEIGRIGVSVLWLTLGLGLADVRADDAPATMPATAPATGKVDNPLYPCWSKFEVGASCTCETDMDNGNGRKFHIEGTFTLKSKTDDSVTVEMSSKIDGNAMPAHTQSFPAKIPADDVKKTGEQDVTAAGKTYKCTSYELGPASMGVSPAGS